MSITSNYGFWFYLSLFFPFIEIIFLIFYIKENGIKDRISDLQNDYFGLVESNIKEINEQLKQVKIQKKFYQNQEQKYYLQSKLLEIKRFLDFFSFYFNETEILSFLQQESQKMLDFETISKYYQENQSVPKSIFELLWMDFYSIPTEKIWTEIRDNHELVRQIIKIIVNAEKLTPKYKKIPFNVLYTILANQKLFSIKIFSQNINYLSEFTNKIYSFYNFLQEEKINFQEYSLWNEVLKWKDIFIKKPNNFVPFWDIYMKCIQLDKDLEYKDEIKNIIVFFYKKETNPEEMESFTKKISKSEKICKLLYYFSRNKEDDVLGIFIINHQEKIRNFIQSSSEDTFFRLFYKEIKKGIFIYDNNKLFKIHVDDGVFDLSYLNQLFFNPSMPINFEYAFNYYFKLNTSITTLLRNLKIEGKHKLFLLTFTSKSGAGGIAKAINELDKFPKIELKYDLLQYSDSARIGISKKEIFDLEELRKEMLIDLKKTIPKLEVADKLTKDFKNFMNKCYFPIKILNTIEIKKLNQRFDKLIKLEIENPETEKSDIIYYLEDLNLILENHVNFDKVKSDYKLIWKKLRDNIENYPPNYQILLHELENNPKKIEVFGDYQKIDPFIKIKELYANRTENKESLIISAEFQEASSAQISIEEINQKLINSLPFYSLVSKEIKNIKENSKFEKVLNKDFLNSIIAGYFSQKCSFLEFCFKLTEAMGIKGEYYYELKDFQEHIEKILKNNTKCIEKTVKILKENLSKHQKLFDDILINKIANSFIKSCICISVTIFKRIQDASKILNEGMVKDVKTKFLTEITLDVVREKKFNQVFYSLLNFYRAKKIRPLFKATDTADEKSFHDKVFDYLFDKFPDDIEDESDVAHGKLDMMVNKIPVELKFERKENDIKKIYEEAKDQFYDYLYKKDSQIGFLYVFENTEKGPKYPKKDINVYIEQDYYCVILILRGNFPKSSNLKKRKGK